MALVLHHYEGSLFSEKIRLMLGYYGLSWESVEISPIMPRPALMPLTGGYRRTPVLQDGADIFCDTHAISEYLDVLCPEKALAPRALAHASRSLAERADTHLFQVVVALCFQPAAVAPMMAALGPEMAEKFAADRAELSGGRGSIASLAPSAAEAALQATLVPLEGQLVHGPFLLGDAPTIADFSIYHCLWLLARNPVVSPLLAPFEAVGAWMARLAAFGHGPWAPRSADEALAVGREAEPQALPPAWAGAASVEAGGPALGSAVSVTPLDYGCIPVTGTLAYATDQLCGVDRVDAQAGRLRVHFPRVGFELKAEG